MSHPLLANKRFPCAAMQPRHTRVRGLRSYSKRKDMQAFL